MKRFALIALILIGTSTVAACHTVEGAGHDITEQSIMAFATGVDIEKVAA